MLIRELQKQAAEAFQGQASQVSLHDIPYNGCIEGIDHIKLARLCT